MDLYMLNGWNFQKDYLIDGFESLIWRERYCGHGDFKMTLERDYFLTENLQGARYLTHSDTDAIMMVETADIKKQTPGHKDLVILSGRSMEAMFYRKHNHAISTPTRSYGPARPGPTSEYFVERYVINPATALPNAAVPNLNIGVINTYRGPSYKRVFDRGNIYDIITPLLNEVNLGWKIRLDDDGQMYYDVYWGADRTEPGPTYLEFSPDTNSLINISSLESNANWMNHALVTGATQTVDVYGVDTYPGVSGLDRRSTYGSYPDVNRDGDLTAAEEIEALTEIGRDLLRLDENRYFKVIDGDVPRAMANAIDYNLGDRVIVRDLYGTPSKMRITESILTIDVTGTVRNPTFELLEEAA